MNPFETTISIIIPTHNRMHSAKRLLDKLAHQTYPKHLMEVVMVANDCSDGTIKMLQEYKATYKLSYAETKGAGPAVPRNSGASIANGTLLIFLDDDVDPCNELAEGHVTAHENNNTVVMGYLPFAIPAKPGFFKKNLHTWWENKFYKMSRKGHRFTYEDLLSGNFSISADLFRKVGGFITTLTCRDDYELGIRLINAGADFAFSNKAWGYHRDEVTDLKRSIKRKREEGRIDVRLWRMHPEVLNSLQRAYRENKSGFLQSRTALLMIHCPNFTDTIAKNLVHAMTLLEKLNFRGKWERLSYKLHSYWYYRGLLDELVTKNELNGYCTYVPSTPAALKEIDIDLEDGLEKAEALLDKERPHMAHVKFGGEMIGFTPLKPGAENLKGKHLRRILARKLSRSLMKTLALKEMKN